MKTTTFAALPFALALGTGAALAQGAVDPAVDTDADGMYSAVEIQTVWPEITAEIFTELDANGDGLLDEAEVAAAQEAGTLPAAQ